jgi:hypothetical protein
MKRPGILTVAGALALALCVGAGSLAQAQGPPGGGGPGGGRRGGFGFGFGRGPMMSTDPAQSNKSTYLMNPAVQTELKITPDQLQKLRDAEQEVRQSAAPPRPDFQSWQGLSPEDRQAKITEFRQQMQTSQRAMVDMMNSKLPDILSADQVKRLDQIDLQQRGVLALADDKVADQVGLDADAQRQVANIAGEFKNVSEQQVQATMAANRRNFAPGGGPGGGGPGGGGFQPPDPATRAAMQASMQKLQADVAKYKKEAEGKVMALLTDDQKKTWKSLLGKPFTMPTPTFGQGRQNRLNRPNRPAGQ